MLNKRAQKAFHLAEKGTPAILFTGSENVRYLTGFSGSEGSLLLTRRGGFFLTDGRYTVQAKNQVKAFKVITFREKWKALGRLIEKLKVPAVAYESNHLTLTFFDALKKEAQKTALIPLEDRMDRLRVLKQRDEISALKKAAKIAAKSLKAVFPLIVPGVSEIDIASELEYRMRKNGGESLAFPTIVASGHRSALPHGTATDKKIEKGDFVTIDYGTVYNGYASDETCTVVVGKATQKQLRVYDTVKKAHDRALKKIRPGISFKKIDLAARNHIEKKGFGKYFNHGTGHGVGLCVHESPVVSFRSQDVVEPGMVFTIEPGIYLPGWGGVRIEDTVLVKKTGIELITKTDKTLKCVGQ